MDNIGLEEATLEAPLDGEFVTREGRGVPTENQIVATLNKVEGVVAGKKAAAIEASALVILDAVKVVRFRGKLLVQDSYPFKHFKILTKTHFDEVAYPLLGGVNRSMIGDIHAFVSATSDDLSSNGHLIGFGQTLTDVIVEADTDLAFLKKNTSTVWNMRDLSVEHGTPIDDTVWRSPFARVASDKHEPLEFIMQLAGNDKGMYSDIMQSLAPIIMDKKPDGVIWWVGAGANGKSTLMDAIYKIFPNQLASINVKRLTDGRDTPSLNGKLANVVKESSEGRVDDTEIYKALGTHEDFRVHKFHSQEDVQIDGNIHTIFSGNSIPTFNDKGYSARRRTFILPFTQQFESDPNFEKNTFTPQFFGELIAEMCRYAVQLKEQGYRYKWSGKTLNAKLEYDKEANNAEEYASQMVNEGIVAFTSFQPLRMDYENWCAETGVVPLGIGNLRKAINAFGFERSSTREDGAVISIYKLPNVATTELQMIGMGRLGMYTTLGFRPKESESVKVEETKPRLDPKW